MKKFLLALIAALALSAPAFAQFSLTGQVQTTYTTKLGSGLSAGVLGRLNVPITPSFGLGLLIRPFIQYDADLVSDGPLSVTAFARARLPLFISIAPTSGFSASLDPQAGIDLTYDLGNNLSLLAGAEFDTSIAFTGGGGFSYSLSSYAELDYALDATTLYGGFGLGLLPTPVSWYLYLGATGDIVSNLGYLVELDTNFSYFDLLLRLIIKL